MFVCFYLDPEDLELIYIKPKEALSPVMKPKHKQHEDDPSLTLVIKNPIYTPGDDTVAREIPTMSKVKQPYLLFRDIDKTSGMDMGWRRINSLRHYFRIFNVRNGIITPISVKLTYTVKPIIWDIQ